MTKPQIEVFHFLKFGAKEHITDLFENGTIYCKPFDYFINIEDQEVRGDKYEGTKRISNYHEHQKLEVRFKIKETGKTINLNPKFFHLREHVNDIQGNLFCLYALKTPEISTKSSFKIDSRVSEFGSLCLKINDVKEFHGRLTNELKKQNQNYRTGLIEYYDKHKINDEIGLFRKPLEFEWQKEFRLFIDRQQKDSFTFKLGSLKDIAEIHDTEKIINYEWINDTQHSV